MVIQTFSVDLQQGDAGVAGPAGTAEDRDGEDGHPVHPLPQTVVPPLHLRRGPRDGGIHLGQIQGRRQLRWWRDAEGTVLASSERDEEEKEERVKGKGGGKWSNNPNTMRAWILMRKYPNTYCMCSTLFLWGGGGGVAV